MRIIRPSDGFCGKEWKNNRLQASFTVEATMVLSLIFAAFMGLVRYAYVSHDVVTGIMILEEGIERSRCAEFTEAECEKVENEYENIGNPRLWLGEYGLELNVGERTVLGKASAGNWSQEMERTVFRPGQFLRKLESIKTMQEKRDGQS